MMKKKINAAIAALGAISCAITAAPAIAQSRTHDNSNYRGDSRQQDRHQNRAHYRTYGGENGYNGYKGRWRTGQRFNNYRNQQYVISDYRRYNLPPPRQGYRYYRDNNGDVVMAAIATGVIGLILGGALNGR